MKIRKFQMGGEMPQEAMDPMAAPGAPMPQEAQQGGGDPIEQIIQMAAAAVESGDPQIAMEVCAALVSIAGGGQQGPAEEPVMMKKGGTIKMKKKSAKRKSC